MSAWSRGSKVAEIGDASLEAKADGTGEDHERSESAWCRSGPGRSPRRRCRLSTPGGLRSLRMSPLPPWLDALQIT
ncbi:hypothetical protein SHIRM173S_11207 [Streptomyces hirsutus]